MILYPFFSFLSVVFGGIFSVCNKYKCGNVVTAAAVVCVIDKRGAKLVFLVRVLPAIVSISDEHKKIYAYNKTIVDLDEDTFAIDTINMDILLNKGYIHEFTYTIKMPLSNYQAIRFANERIYGDVDYYDISEYRHVCGWCIGKDYMYLNYILSAQQTEYIYIIN